MRSGFALFLWLCAAAAFAGNPYSGRSDAELTNLAADWETLPEVDRRALLTEMRSRMATMKAKQTTANANPNGQPSVSEPSGRIPVIAIRTQRRYGRLVRQPDGSVVRVETTENVIRFHRLPESATGAPDRAFGVGFERRAGEGDPVLTPATTKVSADVSATVGVPPAPPANPVRVEPQPP